MSDTKSSTSLSRRRVFAGAGTVGALAAAAAALPLARQAEPAPAAAPAETPDTAAGYRLSAHVQRYYQTAKV
ncbi:formate dehydrogenase [Ideonella sp.]|uniref:formate dehydrogenase n=1 Tax=Ideonella sp. TaxID=1929293 RepID=UPI002B465FCE|nr:formate dehydrogenase [Ideonella sp.]HJV71891.1 formate dehydrogenase [Ideonella sp.]